MLDSDYRGGGVARWRVVSQIVTAGAAEKNSVTKALNELEIRYVRELLRPEARYCCPDLVDYVDLDAGDGLNDMFEGLVVMSEVVPEISDCYRCCCWRCRCWCCCWC